MSTDKPSHSSSQDKAADRVIAGMIASVVGTAIVPTYVNWSLTAAAMGTGVVGIGLCYDVKLQKDEAWKLIIQFLRAAGLWFTGMVIGSRMLSFLLTGTGLGYGAAVALDATTSAALAYAIGGCAKAYFAGERNNSALGQMVRQLYWQARTKPSTQQ